jgi:hypothetical protein
MLGQDKLLVIVGILAVIGRKDLMIKIAKRIFNHLAYLIL